MRLVRVAYQETPHYGFLQDDDETVTLLSGENLLTLAPSGESTSLAESPWLVPATPSKIIGVGRNYSEHAAEMGLRMGERPSVFLKPLQTLLAPDGAVVLPAEDVSQHVEHEAELAVVIGRAARNVPAHEAFAHILGFTCADDVSARDVQRSDPQLTRGKGFDTFCPLGAWIETNVDDQVREISCHVNGELRQQATTDQMLFDIPTLIQWLSSWTTLVPGDVILTGSPGGTGPLRPGDTVEIAIGGIGFLSHRVIGP